MAVLFKSYYCKHVDNLRDELNGLAVPYAVPLVCPMEKSGADRFCVGCEFLLVKTELV